MGPCKSGSPGVYSYITMEGTDSDDDHVTSRKKSRLDKDNSGGDDGEGCGDDGEGCGDDYKMRRRRNNVAVRKSRDKSRKKAKDTMEKVNRLRMENEALEMKVQTLSKELSVLKDLFLAHAGTVAEGNCSVVSNSSVQSDHKYFKDEK
ncbi:CCAAT/enhancer-binding protein gamma-like [Gigantopelta aegis]|uniref:CCAAT/enhancer-binding protein gamma-like n=1 Tax=Gigantopelta aegis TaxID=1735272 RepID=UPI001B8886C4|nr:CCAAT/enhancer-binding protein gamma-like [Gigantopelta aegis]XP_041375204.1 CCAAT/enhancer-binding protein gamma-like [Gigantopelta aegis]XP_041375205.1 CCAAT/enhancer-binding protein gamma-like [Gigantopelta aegis]XP_041375206.1 CCAAT/enhancer-binding protein gamma-like [Gigantopelta aegis]